MKLATQLARAIFALAILFAIGCGSVDNQTRLDGCQAETHQYTLAAGAQQSIDLQVTGSAVIKVEAHLDDPALQYRLYVFNGDRSQGWGGTGLFAGDAEIVTDEVPADSYQVEFEPLGAPGTNDNGPYGVTISMGICPAASK